MNIAFHGIPFSLLHISQPFPLTGRGDGGLTGGPLNRLISGGEIFEDEVEIPGKGAMSYLYRLSARLEELRSEVDGDAAALANVHRELAHLLRTAYGDSSHGWSDEEWVERAELSEEQRADLRVVLSTCAEVKYGGARPTRFAVEETLDRVSTLLIEADEVAA